MSGKVAGTRGGGAEGNGSGDWGGGGGTGVRGWGGGGGEEHGV